MDASRRRHLIRSTAAAGMAVGLFLLPGQAMLTRERPAQAVAPDEKGLEQTFAVVFPGPAPGPAGAGIAGGRLRLANRVLAEEWAVEGKTLRFVEFRNALSGVSVTGAGDELFALDAPPLTLRSADFTVEGVPRIEELKPEPKAARVARRLDGCALVARLRHRESGTVVEWRAELRENSHYVRQVMTLRGPAGGSTIKGLDLLCVTAAGAAVVGSVPGSPVVAGQTFLGVELPMASARVEGDIVRWRIAGDIRFSERQPCRFGSVIGVLPAGQARRAFAAYLERERARESRPFLHYNCWYDLGEGVNEQDMRRVVALFEKELIRERGVRLESFVLDDGWDDPKAGFWEVNKNKFPDGFGPLRGDLARAGSRLGLWISPLAGYGGQADRVERAREAGLVAPGAGLSLDMPSYYDWWLRRCSSFIRDEGVNYFKWDNAANFVSLARVAEELRSIDPHLFINTTVNTFPSPFFLNTMDATWRGGDDCGWFGPGSSREQYITYRDKELYTRVVRQAPLYPINSIMHCAPVLGRHYQAAKIAGDMKNDCRALFGMGPVLQELYIGPDLMTERWWDELAEAIRWAHANAGVLTDAHWVGGDPGRLEIYGCAAWSPRKGTVMLRNPADRRASATLDIERVFELPAGAARAYDLTAAYPDQRVGRLLAVAGTPLTLEMEPFEVLVFGASPAQTTLPQPSSQSRSAPSPPPPPPPQAVKIPPLAVKGTERMIDVGGRRLHSVVYGSGGPTVVLVSGFRAPQEYWNPVVSGIAGITTVVTFDRAGYGKSERGDLPVHGKQTAADLHILLGKLEVPKPYILVGHSYGGRIVRLFATAYPSDTAGLVLEEAAHEDLPDAQLAVLTGKDHETLAAMVAPFRTTVPDPRTESDYMAETVEQLRRSGPLPRVPLVVITAASRASGLPAVFSPENQARLVEVAMAMQKKLADLVPGGEQILVEGAGHNVHLDKPEAVIAPIRAMIARLRG